MTEPTGDPLKLSVNKARLEFLYDGIFAIAMTILVPELKIPDLTGHRSGAELLRRLAADAPAFGSWLLSFVMLGLFWFQHQRVYRWLDRVTRLSLVIHLELMATAAFFPFCAALLGRYPGNRVAAVAYFACAWLHFTGIAALWLAGEGQKALSPALGPGEVRRLRKRYLRAPVAVLALTIAYYLLMPHLR